MSKYEWVESFLFLKLLLIQDLMASRLAKSGRGTRSLASPFSPFPPPLFSTSEASASVLKAWAWDFPFWLPL